MCECLLAQWTNYAPIPTARWGQGMVAYGGKLYAITGNLVTTTEVYTPGSNSWATLAPIPQAVTYPAIAAWNGKIYCMGGWIGAFGQNFNQIYDIATNTWSTGAPMLQSRYGGVAVAYNGRIYHFGGYQSAILQNSLEIYDIASNTWSVGAPSSLPRYETGAGLIGSKMYVFGGMATYPPSTGVTLLEAYDIPSNTWQTLAPMNNDRYIHAGGSDGTLLYAAGGFPNTGTFETYNPATNTWTTRAPLNFPRYRTSGAVLNGCFYVTGGVTSSPSLNNHEGVCGLTPLPIGPEIYLETELVHGAVHLMWNAMGLVEGSIFQIERSTDGTHFERIDDGAATTSWDRQPSARALWYRIHHTTANGEEIYSNIAYVELERNALFSYDQVGHWLHYLPVLNDHGKANLIDMGGKMVFQADFPSSSSSESIVWSLENLPAGVYVFQFIGTHSADQRKLIR
jgi:hypothetical protein